jgi:hypothetical protein
VLEFLYLYLLPEQGSCPDGNYTTDTMKRVPKERSSSGGDVTIGEISLIGDDGKSTLKSSKEKQRLLGKHLGDVQVLFQDFAKNRIFEETRV